MAKKTLSIIDVEKLALHVIRQERRIEALDKDVQAIWSEVMGDKPRAEVEEIGD